MRTRRKQRMLFRKHNQNRLGEFEIIVKDGFFHRTLDIEAGELEPSLKRILKRLDEKYNFAWSKIVPDRFLDKNFERKRRK